MGFFPIVFLGQSGHIIATRAREKPRVAGKVKFSVSKPPFLTYRLRNTILMFVLRDRWIDISPRAVFKNIYT